jgi:uncharacterized membrane protein
MKGAGKAALCFGLLLAGACTPQYLLTDLGTFPGDTSSTAMDINDSRVVVGYSSSPQAYGTKDHAFRWIDHLQDLVHLPEATWPFSSSFVSARALAINNDNFIVGDSLGYFGYNIYHAFLWNPNNGPTQDLLDLGALGGRGHHSSPTSINGYKQVVGFSFTGVQWHGFIWDSREQMQDIGVVAGGPHALYPGELYAGAINNAQQVVGIYSSDQGWLAFIWVPGRPMQLIPMQGGRIAAVYDVNESGTFVGSCVRPIGAERHPVVGSTGGVHELNGLPGAPANAQSEAYGVNKNNDVVGYALGPSGKRAVIWSTTFGLNETVIWSRTRDPKDLNGLIYQCDPLRNSVVLTEARAINKSGDIAATGTVGGVQHAFLLTNVYGPGVRAPECPTSPTP